MKKLTALKGKLITREHLKMINGGAEDKVKCPWRRVGNNWVNCRGEILL